jgi:uncharacterized repeat protein (TIGR01451 family)
MIATVARQAFLALGVCFCLCAGVEAAVGVNKSFTPNSVVAGQPSTLTIILLNPNPAAATAAALTDTLPAGVVVATPPVVTNSCGLVTDVTAVAGSNSVSLANGTIPAASLSPGQCQFTVNVTSSTANTYLDNIAANAVSSSQGSNPQNAQATLVVTAPANVTASKAFLPTNVHGGGTSSTLTITLTNPNPVALTNAAILDTLPATITIAATPNATTTCGAGTATPSSSASNPATIALSGGTIPANGSCTISVAVVARNPNALTNGNSANAIAAGALTTTEGATSPAISANVNVQTGAQVAKAFAPALIAPNGSSTLTITVTDFNATALSPITFTDTLPGAITATALPVSTCGGSITTVPAQPAPPPYTHFAITGGSLAGVVGPAAGSTTCTITVPVTATATATNTLVANNFGGVAIAAASGTLSVSGITGSKSFTVPAVQTGSTTMTITLNNMTATSATITSFTDLLTTMGTGFTVGGAPIVGAADCGASITAPVGGTSITATGGTIPALGSCTITIPIAIAANATTGNRTNTIAINGVHTSQGNNAVTITGQVAVSVALAVAKAFNPATVEAGAASRLTVTLTHTNGAVGLSNISFTDDLTTMGAGFVVAPIPNATTTCTGGTVTAVAGATNFSLSGGTLGAGATSCTVAVNVATPAGTTTPVSTNTIAANTVTTTPQVTNAAANATLTRILSSVTINKSFSPTTVAIGGVSTLAIQIRNNNASATNLTAIGLTDNLPAGMAVAAVPTTSFTGAGCSGATITAPAGATQVVLSGANVNANSICTLSVHVVANVAGNLINTIPASSISSAQGVTNPLQGTATLAATGTIRLTITKTDGVASAIPGSTTTYTIGVTNSGPNDVTGLGVNDTPPAGLTFTSWTCAASAGSACPASGSGSIAASVTVLNGGSVTFTVSAAIASSAVGSITNTASLVVPGSVIDTNPVTSASDTDTLTPQADLAISKTDGMTTVVPGSPVTYTIVASNNGPSDATGATVTDALPASITGATWTCTATAGSSCSSSGSGNINASVNLLAGGSASFTLNGTVSAATTGTVSNTATVTVPVGVIDPNPGNNSATDTDTVTSTADLSITKTDGVTSVNAGGSTIYTIVAGNSGPSSVTGAMVTDNAPANLTLGSWTCSASTGSSCPASGSGNIAVAVNLLSGGSVTFTVNATIAGGATGTIANTATIAVPVGVSDPNPGNNSATDTDTVGLVADLAITKTDGVTSVSAGGSTIYTIVATNNGPSAVIGATVTDNAPANLTIGSWTCSASAGSSCPASGSGNIAASVNLLNGGSATFTVNATIAGGATGTIANTATIAVPVGVTDPNPGNNSATDTDTVGLAADLAITKTDGVASVVPGTGVTYTIIATNNGPSAVTGAMVADTLPAALTGVTWTCVASGGSSCPASGLGNINAAVNLLNGGTASFTLTGTVSPSATGTLVNTATVMAPGGVTDPNPANNSATDTDNLTPQVTLAVVKTDGSATYTPGATATYTITVTDTGLSDARSVTVTDGLPTGVTLTANATCVASGIATCGTLTGTIGQAMLGTTGASVGVGAGNSLTLVAPVAFASSLTADPLINAATATDVPTGATATGVDSDMRDAQVTLAVAKTDGSASYTPGGIATYVVTIMNAGASDALDVTVSDLLPAGVILTANVSCVANGVSACGTVTGSVGQTSLGTTGARVSPGAGNSLIFTVPVTFASGMTANPLVNTATATDAATGASASGSDTDALAPLVSLAVVKSDGSSTYTPGGSATYTVTVTHGGVSDATNVTINDPLPAGVTLSGNVSCVANGGASCGTVSGSAGQTSFGATGAQISAGVGNSLVFTVPVTFAAGMTANPLVNTATATDLLSGATGAGTDSDALALQVSLAVTKTDGTATYTPGSTATYMISVVDTGSSDALGVTVNDALPVGVTLSGSVTCVASGSANCGTVTGSTGQTSFGTTGARVAAGAGNSIVFTAPVAFASDLADDPLVNAATAMDLPSGATGSGSDSDARAAQAVLNVTKSDGNATYTPGGAATYTVIVTNAGPSDALSVTVSDPLPAGVTRTANATCTATGNASCGAVTGSTGQTSFGTTGARIGAGAANVLTFTAPVAFAPSLVTDPLINTVTVSDPASASPVTATDSDALAPTADLSITKTDGVTSVNAGGTTTYVIIVSNAGPSGANGAIFMDPAVVNLTATSVICGGATGGAACPTAANTTVALMQGSGIVVPTLPAGGSVAFTVSATVAAGATGSIANTATIAAPAGVTDPNSGNNSETDTDTVGLGADLSITKTDGVTSINAGASTIYTIVATNNGPSAVTGAMVTDIAPAGLTLSSWTCGASAGSSCPASGTGNIAAAINLLNGGSATFTVNATVSASASGTIANTATIAAPAGVTDPNPGNNSATDTDTVALIADLGITKTDGSATYTPGGNVTYTIVATNAGPRDVTGAAVVDALPAAITGATWTCVAAGGGSCPASGSGNINAAVNLPAGGSATFTLSGTVAATTTGNLVNTATVTAPAGITDPNPGNNSATDTDAPTASATLAVTKTDGSTTYTPGGTAIYTITVTNRGPSNAANVSVTDNLPPGVTLIANVACAATGAATCGSVTGAASAATFTATGATIAAGSGNRLVYTLPVQFANNLTTNPLVNTVTASDPTAGTVASDSDSNALSGPPVQIPIDDRWVLAMLGGLILLVGWRSMRARSWSWSWRR